MGDSESVDFLSDSGLDPFLRVVLGACVALLDSLNLE